MNTETVELKLSSMGGNSIIGAYASSALNDDKPVGNAKHLSVYVNEAYADTIESNVRDVMRLLKPTTLTLCIDRIIY